MARLFGVEIEISFGRRDSGFDKVLECVRAFGVTVEDWRSRYSGNSRHAWVLKYDSSVDHGCEIVSPPLDFDDAAQREQVTKVILALQAANCVTTETGGIHVHVEAKNAAGTIFDGKQIASVVRFCHKFEDAIYRIASSGYDEIRHGAYYCGPIPQQIAQDMMGAKTHDDVRRVWDGQSAFRFNMDRYKGCNIRSFWIRNTIEFRYFNTTLNPKRAQAYIALCMAIMKDAALGYSRSVKKAYKPGEMLHGNVKEEAVLMRLQQILTTESRDTTRLMSKEDWKLIRYCWNTSKPQYVSTSGSRH